VAVATRIARGKIPAGMENSPAVARDQRLVVFQLPRCPAVEHETIGCEGRAQRAGHDRSTAWIMRAQHGKIDQRGFGPRDQDVVCAHRSVRDRPCARSRWRRSRRRPGCCGIEIRSMADLVLHVLKVDAGIHYGDGNTGTVEMLGLELIDVQMVRYSRSVS